MFKALSRLWKSDSRKDRVDLRPRDCHAHILPGVDDGSRSMEESIAMLRLLYDAGARTVISTSHIFPGRFDNEPEGLRTVFEDVDRARAEAGIDLTLELGAEHWLDDSLVSRIEAGRVLAFGPERYVLFETSTGVHVPAELMSTVEALRNAGYTPLMAHVERYAYLRDDDGKELALDLRALGVKFQVNRTVGKANVPGEGSRGKFIAWLLERGFVDEVGSDLHRPTPEGRPYAMGS